MDKLKLFYDLKSDKKVAEKLGVNYNTVKSWSNRGSIPTKTLLKSIQNETINIDWLLLDGKYSKSSHPVNGKDIVSINGSGNSVGNISKSINYEISNKPYNDEINEIAKLLQEYGYPKMIKDLKEKLYQIKALHE